MATMTTYEVVMTNGNETFHVGFTAEELERRLQAPGAVEHVGMSVGLVKVAK
jgi:hypothetical protein